MTDTNSDGKALNSQIPDLRTPINSEGAQQPVVAPIEVVDQADTKEEVVSAQPLKPIEPQNPWAPRSVKAELTPAPVEGVTQEPQVQPEPPTEVNPTPSVPAEVVSQIPQSVPEAKEQVIQAELKAEEALVTPQEVAKIVDTQTGLGEVTRNAPSPTEGTATFVGELQKAQQEHAQANPLDIDNQPTSQAVPVAVETPPSQGAEPTPVAPAPAGPEATPEDSNQ